MLKPDDIKTSKEPTPLIRDHVRVRAVVQVGAENVTLPDYATDAERDCKAIVWRGIYGDLERALYDMKREILSGVSLVPGAYEQTCRAIAKVEALVRNPFDATTP